MSKKAWLFVGESKKSVPVEGLDNEILDKLSALIRTGYVSDFLFPMKQEKGDKECPATP